MYRFETLVTAGHEAERVTTAFYRFLEVRSAPHDADASVHTEILGAKQRCTVSLWSEDARLDFERYLGAFMVEPPKGLPPRPFGLR